MRSEREWIGAQVQQESNARVAFRLGARFGAGLQLTAQDATPWQYAIRDLACQKVMSGLREKASTYLHQIMKSSISKALERQFGQIGK